MSQKEWEKKVWNLSSDLHDRATSIYESLSELDIKSLRENIRDMRDTLDYITTLANRQKRKAKSNKP